MANALYGQFKQRVLQKQLNLSSDTIKALLIDSTHYTVSINVDANLADISGSAIVATSGALAGQTITVGVFTTNDFAWTSVSGATSSIIVIYDDTYVNKALMAYYDTGISGMPVVPNGSNVNVSLSASGWFSL